jgi:excisionase family DNA binding protein
MEEQLETLLTVSQVARLCRLKPSTVYSAVSRNLIPAVVLWKGKRRRVVRFRRSDIDQLIRDRSVPAREHTGKR